MFALPNPDYERHPLFRRQLEQVDDALRAQALAKFLPQFESCFQSHLNAPKLGYDVRIEEGDALLGQLQRTGCGVQHISAERKAALAALTIPRAEFVLRRFAKRTDLKFRDSQFVFDRAEHADVFAAVERIFEEEHVYKAASAYAGKPLLLKEVTVQVNTDARTRQQYGELDADNLPTPRTGYMHIDSGMWPPVKVLIYLDEVTADQGPFRYVEGSHRWLGDFELMVRKANDRQNIHGELFMALPEPFRMYTLFGDDIDPDSEGARRLLAHERACLSRDGDLILFDFNGVHRGGFVRTGCRYMLQCHLELRGKVLRQISSVLGVEDQGAG